MCVCACACVCVCVCAHMCVCVCVCMCGGGGGGARVCELIKKNIKNRRLQAKKRHQAAEWGSPAQVMSNMPYLIRFGNGHECSHVCVCVRVWCVHVCVCVCVCVHLCSAEEIFLSF